MRSPVEMREGHSRQGLSPRDSWSLTGASRGTRKRGTSANRLRRLGARSRRRVRSSASPVAASTFPPSGLCRSPATRKSHEKSRKNCLPGTNHELYDKRREPFPRSLGATSLSCSARSAARLPFLSRTQRGGSSVWNRPYSSATSSGFARAVPVIVTFTGSHRQFESTSRRPCGETTILIP